jgi:hypothetical protein
VSFVRAAKPDSWRPFFFVFSVIAAQPAFVTLF